MALRRFRAPIALLSAAIVFVVAAAAEEADAAPPPAPPLWRLADEDTEIWLFGAYYAPPAGRDWRSDALARAIDSAETIWFEADADAPGAAEAVAGLMQTAGTNPDGTKLTRLLGEDALGLAAIATNLDIDVGALEPMRPWRAHLILTVRFIAEQGVEPGAGVEKQLLAEAKARGRNLRFLQTIEQQVSTFAALSSEAERNLLKGTIRHWTTQAADFDKAGEAWRVGDLDALDGYLNAALRESAPGAYETLVIDRNEAWAEKIARLMAEPGDILIAAPAAHFVGPDSIIDQLTARGFAPTRVDGPED